MQRYDHKIWLDQMQSHLKSFKDKNRMKKVEKQKGGEEENKGERCTCMHP